jgi:hypothetical protein
MKLFGSFRYNPADCCCLHLLFAKEKHVPTDRRDAVLVPRTPRPRKAADVQALTASVFMQLGNKRPVALVIMDVDGGRPWPGAGPCLPPLGWAHHYPLPALPLYPTYVLNAMLILAVAG